MKRYSANMLTKSDLSQIDKVVKRRIREEVEAEGENIKDELSGRILNFRLEMLNNIGELSDRIKNLEVRTNNLGKSMNKGFKNIEKKLKKTSDFLDRDSIKTKKKELKALKSI